jgi:type II secretory pathway pseudopilin PulG
LNPRPTNFTTFNDRATSLLSLLYEQNKIPSLSFSYSAGAKYRLNEVLGSLTLGGYDDSLYEPNDLTFDFYFDQTRDLTVGLQAITSTTATGNTSLLPKPDLYLIDSTIAQNYLAPDACQAFENAFGLTLDNTTGLYLLNDTQHENLLKLSPSVTFTIGAEATGGQTVNITFPYAAFDLNVSYPITQNATRYFPIVPATNSTQYTLGRQFLQEAYITIDYQRQNFSVYQRTWNSSTAKHIVSITPPNSTETSTPGPTATGSGNSNTKKKISGMGIGAIIGIVVGAIAILVLIGGLLFLRRQRKRKAAQKEAAELAAAIENEPKEKGSYADTTPGGVNELESPFFKPPELHSESYFSGSEMDSSQVAPTPEMEGDRVYYELEAPHGMTEVDTRMLEVPERQDSNASSPTWNSRSPIRHLSDAGG